MSKQLTPVMTAAEVEHFISTQFPQLNGDRKAFQITEIGNGYATMQLDAKQEHLRPGGTVSGPALFTLADVCAYAAILAHIGPVALAVTTNLNINFLRKASPGAVNATARFLKLGKRLAVLDVTIIDGDNNEIVAHATTTYSIPPK